MSVVDELVSALSETKKSKSFDDQIKAYEAFRVRMEAAGVTPKKQEFSIPLIERIGTLNFSN